MPKFSDFGLDLRILKAIEDLGWSEPTPIQEKILTYSTEGRDIVARACTGSGKTGAFLIPVVQAILSMGNSDDVVAIILSPTKEISHQTHKFLKDICKYAGQVTSINLSDDSTLESQKALLNNYKPNVIISTCKQLVQHLFDQRITINESFKILAIDEADLCLGIPQRCKKIIELKKTYLPLGHQSMLMSATLGPDSYRHLSLNNPVVLNLNRSYLPPSFQLAQYVLSCAYKEKYQVLVALFKLGIINQRLLIFVNSVDKCYRLKLFLEQFSIRSCVLNPLLPLASRIHAVEQFNSRVYDIVIASADSTTPSKGGKEEEYSMARGVDFHNISYVLNFDFPPSYISYVHRVGRTARVKNKGVALSFVSPMEEKLLEGVVADMGKLRGGDTLVPYPFKMEDIVGFRYRVLGALGAVTKLAVKEARVKEIKEEILNSDKLTSYLERRCHVLNSLRHDKSSKCAVMPLTVKHIPEYILPPDYKDVGLKTPIFSKKRRKRKNVHSRSNKTNVLKSLRISK